MFGEVLDALRFLGSAFTGARQLRSQDREKFAKICDEISNVIEEFIKAPQDRSFCAELREYVLPIRNLASGRIASDEIDRLATTLNSVCDAWSKLHGTAEADLNLDSSDLDQLKEAKGLFRGLVNRLRAI